jgi:hypothetical protein
VFVMRGHIFKRRLQRDLSGPRAPRQPPAVAMRAHL